MVITLLALYYIKSLKQECIGISALETPEGTVKK